MGLSYVGEEQAQIVVDFRGCGDGGSRVRSGASLFDCNGRRQALDVVHLGLLHLVEKLPGVGGEGLDIFALSFGKDSVKSQRRFSRTAQPGDHDQPVAGNIKREILQVVFTRAADSDKFLRHRAGIVPSSYPPSLIDASAQGKWLVDVASDRPHLETTTKLRRKGAPLAELESSANPQPGKAALRSAHFQRAASGGFAALWWHGFMATDFGSCLSTVSRYQKQPIKSERAQSPGL